jgi:hypothetical protein
VLLLYEAKQRPVPSGGPGRCSLRVGLRTPIELSAEGAELSRATPVLSARPRCPCRRAGGESLSEHPAAGPRRDTGSMKLQATIVISYRSDSLAEAGEKLDDVLLRAREREDVEIDSIELRTPVSAGPVSLPRIERTLQTRPAPPSPMREGDGVVAR